jgi:RHS repeat-associated protein
VRKQFTGYERDSETDLDFAHARMFAKVLGRFSGSDALLSSGKLHIPQTWHRYSYALNNPLVLVDRFGLYVCKAGKKECEQFDAALEKGRADLANIAKKDKGRTSSKEYKKAERALGVYGAKGVNNGVFILSKEGGGAGRARTSGTTVGKTKDNPTGQKIQVEFDPGTFSSEGLAEGVAHEGSHAADGADWVKSGFKDSMNPTEYQSEFDAYTVSAFMAEAAGERGLAYPINANLKDFRSRFGAFPYSTEIWNSSWAAADVETLRQAGINKLLEYDQLYQLTPTMRSPKKTFDRKSRF